MLSTKVRELFGDKAKILEDKYDSINLNVSSLNCACMKSALAKFLPYSIIPI